MSNLTRRHFFAGSAAGVAAAGYRSHAAAETRPAAALARGFDGNPPFYRTRLGSAELTIISDGTIGLPLDFVLPDIPEEEVESFRTDRYQPTDWLPMQMNVMVIDINGKRVMIDPGCGGKFDPSGGRLPDHLPVAGIDPASVDALVLTHLHPDHLWGATDSENKNPVFENAEIALPERELDFWNDPDLAASMPEGMPRQLAEGAFAHLQRLEDRLRPVAGEGEAVPGIRFVPTPGHTPGHASLAIESEEDFLLSTGDVVADPFFPFEHPDWRIGPDWDPDKGVESRRAVLDRAADERVRAFGFHLPWPGFGHVVRVGDAYRWIPEKWTWEP